MANVVRDPKAHPDAVLPDFKKADPLLTFIGDVNRQNLGINFDPANMILYGSGEPIAASTCRCGTGIPWWAARSSITSACGSSPRDGRG